MLCVTGSKQTELGAGSMQLLHQHCPLAAAMLVVIIPIAEPMGFKNPTIDTLLGFNYTPMAVGAIAISAVFGLLVSLSTFLVIGATSSLTFNIIGLVKITTVVAGTQFAYCIVLPAEHLIGFYCFRFLIWGLFPTHHNGMKHVIQFYPFYS